uniref:Orf1 n=1 Tax=Ullucus polerovirus 1 TaxID=2491943 RepID=A0A3G8FWL6_9VIRU|nr:orf1 [Ullucus polerovirus 1]
MFPTHALSSTLQPSCCFHCLTLVNFYSAPPRPIPLKMNTKRCLSVLLFFFYLSSSLGKSAATEKGFYSFPSFGIDPFYSTELSWGTAPTSNYAHLPFPHPSQEKCVLNCSPCVQQPLTDEPYTSLTTALQQKISADASRIFIRAHNGLANLYSKFCIGLRSYSLLLAGVTLQLIIYVWWNILALSLVIAWRVIREYTLPVLCVISLAVCTSLIYTGLKWIFGKLQVLLITTPVRLIFTVAKFSYSWVVRPKVKLEQTVQGFNSFTIPQSPPRSAVLELVRPNNSHIGFANCIQLQNGSNGLITAYHCMDKGAIVYSRRTLVGIDLSKFVVLAADEDDDIAILRGPTNWESTLGCKGAVCTTKSRLAKSSAAFYNISPEGEWQRNSAVITGTHEGCSTVMSNTSPGDSGTGYWTSKTLLGIHKGALDGHNINLMIPVPDIPGLTKVEYTFETTAPQGRLFIDNLAGEWEEIERDGVKIFRKIAMTKKIKSQDEDFYDVTNEFSPEKPEPAQEASGNEKAAASAQTTASGESSSTRETKNENIENSFGPTSVIPTSQPTVNPAEEVIKQLVARIDLSKIEERIVNKIAEQAMKKPRGTRGGRRRPKTSSNSSAPNTAGTYQPPHKRPQSLDSPRLVPSHPTTAPPRGVRRSGEGSSAKSTLSWRPKPVDSDGPKQGRKQN